MEGTGARFFDSQTPLSRRRPTLNRPDICITTQSSAPSSFACVPVSTSTDVGFRSPNIPSSFHLQLADQQSKAQQPPNVEHKGEVTRNHSNDGSSSTPGFKVLNDVGPTNGSSDLTKLIEKAIEKGRNLKENIIQAARSSVMDGR
ncbi:unnamed protein product [Protopolystoma xenopodis]|uniref:Uncharacterized protein n=1 Tax=Protopolystoma xenopodis TaxID=117903 RepID=A0A3S5BPC6_9PLAT|nr:unnamed protein product [Protopolystoma xenopodis]